MKDHLVRWHEDYAKKGLVIVDVHNGEEDPKDILGLVVQKAGLKYSVLWDEKGKNCTKYGITGYPASFLIGVDGTVIWEGFPLSKVQDVEDLIQAELKKVKTKEEKK